MIDANFQRPVKRNPPKGHPGLFLSVGHSVLLIVLIFAKSCDPTAKIYSSCMYVLKMLSD